MVTSTRSRRARRGKANQPAGDQPAATQTPADEPKTEATKADGKLPIALVLKIGVDVDAWNAEYGTKDSAAAVREQVKEILTEGAKAAVKHLGNAVAIER